MLTFQSGFDIKFYTTQVFDLIEILTNGGV